MQKWKHPFKYWKLGLSEGVTFNLEYRYKSVRKVWTIYKKTIYTLIKWRKFQILNILLILYEATLTFFIKYETTNNSTDWEQQTSSH